ncbi:hypothetical protein BDV96DRAFT_646531 [Lophiotrema nucula]|uniref:Uncharacterized protein n=1 Tax=Lophiotrema nucula TaxID=690887 RepID=A0A6A5Z8K7_9PLEO|nr:hypothetical protein BDV96DRAFT_646531 [Lophiotrema nucula]
MSSFHDSIFNISSSSSSTFSFIPTPPTTSSSNSPALTPTSTHEAVDSIELLQQISDLSSRIKTLTAGLKNPNESMEVRRKMFCDMARAWKTEKKLKKQLGDMEFEYALFQGRRKELCKNGVLPQWEAEWERQEKEWQFKLRQVRRELEEIYEEK